MTAALHCEGIHHRYGAGELEVQVLRGIDLTIQPGECVVLAGPSGSGKTTLLSIAGALLTPGAGTLRIGGEAVMGRTPRGLAALRRSRIGFVFQHAHLLPFLTVWENLEIVARNAGSPPAERKARIGELLETLEMTAHAGKKAAVLSGGQRQRAAVARALLHRPAIVLADEPTSALGWETGQTVVKLLTRHARQEGAGLLVVTHDMRLVPQFDRFLEMTDGKIHPGRLA